MVALKGVLMQIKDFPEYFRKSKLDGLLWFGTFVSVILLGIDYGIIICILLTVFVMTYRNYQIDILEMEDDEDEDIESETASVNTQVIQVFYQQGWSSCTNLSCSCSCWGD